MFNPYDTQAVLDFLAQNAQEDVIQLGTTATGVQKLMAKVDHRARRRRDAKQLLNLGAEQLTDAGWTRHDVAASGVKWGKLVKKHGASSLVRKLKMTLQDATEMGITAPQLLGMTSDLLAEWDVKAPDMIALGATVRQLLDRYETGQNLSDMGFTPSIMVQMGMKPDTAAQLFDGASTASIATESVATEAAHESAVEPAPCLKSLESLSLDASAALDF